MKIHGTFQMGFTLEGYHIRGSYSPSMGHASHLTVDGGENILNDDGEGNLSTHLLTLLAGSQIVSRTKGCTLTGNIRSKDITPLPYDPEGRQVNLEVEGVADGSQGSIVGGISCHCRWTLTTVRKVEGRFGAFTGPDALAKYNQAKDKSRARWIESREVRAGTSEYPIVDIRLYLTPEGRQAALELGYGPDLGWSANEDKTPHLEQAVNFMITLAEPDRRAESIHYWVDQIPERLAQLEKKKRVAEAAKLYRPPAGAVDALIIRPPKHAPGKVKVEWIFA